MWGTLFTTFSGTGLLEFVSLMGVVGTFARKCGLWIFHADFLVRIFWCGFLGADFWVRILGCGFFRAFCGGLCGFWGADFFCGFFGLFSRRKSPEKSHQKIPPKNPHQRSSPRSVSSQYTTTLLLAKHSRSPQSIWVKMHLCQEPFSLRRWRLSGSMSV